MGTTLSCLVESCVENKWDDVAEFDFGKNYALSLWLDNLEHTVQSWPHHGVIISGGIWSPRVASWRAWQLWQDDISGCFMTDVSSLVKSATPDFQAAMPPEMIHGQMQWLALLHCVWVYERANVPTRLLLWRD